MFVLIRLVTTVQRAPGVRVQSAPGVLAPLVCSRPWLIPYPTPTGTKIGKYFDATLVYQRQHTRTQSARPARIPRVQRTSSARAARAQRDALLENCCAAAEQVLSICWAANEQLLITCGATTEQLLSSC